MTQKSSVIINIIAVCLFLLASICGVYAIKEVTIQLGGSVSYQAVNPVNLSTQVTGAKYNGSANTLYVQSDGSINTNNNSFTIDGNCSSLTVNYGNLEFVQNSSGFTNIVTTFSFTNKKSTAICAKLSTDDFNPHPDITCIATDYMLKLNQNDTQTIEVTMGVLGTHATAPSLSTGTLKFTFEEFNVPTWEGSGYSGDVDYENKTISITRVPSGSGELDIPGYFYDSTNDCLLKVKALGTVTSSMPWGGLSGISGYSSVIVPNTVETLNSAFVYTSKLKHVTLKKGLLTISTHAFYYTDIVDLVIPNSVTTIGDNAIMTCPCLTSITIPSSVTSLSSSAFGGFAKLVEVINLSSFSITKGSSDYGGIAQDVLNVKTSGTSDVVNLNDCLFYTAESINYFIGYAGSSGSLTLPANYNGENYRIYYMAFSEYKGPVSGSPSIMFEVENVWEYSDDISFETIRGEETFYTNTNYSKCFAGDFTSIYFRCYWRVKPT